MDDGSTDDRKTAPEGMDRECDSCIAEGGKQALNSGRSSRKRREHNIPSGLFSSHSFPSYSGSAIPEVLVIYRIHAFMGKVLSAKWVCGS